MSQSSRKPVRRRPQPKKPSLVQRALNGVFDSLAEARSPEKAIRRKLWRQAAPRLASIGSGQSSRFNGGWHPVEADADAQIEGEIQEVRRRSRDAGLNNPLAIAIRETMVAHVVGENGIRPRSMVDHERLGITEAQAKEWQDAVNELWKRVSRHADVTGRQQGWGNLLRLVYRSMFDGGDIFPTFPLRAWPDLGRTMTRVNLIDPERVDTPPEKSANRKVRMGVRVNDWGAPTGYYVLRSHPGDRLDHSRSTDYRLWKRTVSGRPQILQLMRQDRVGQSRGIPRLTSVLDMIDQVEQYADSTLLAAELQTRFALFIRTAGDPNAMQGGFGDSQDPNRYEGAFPNGLEPASIHVLNDGDTIETGGATHPSTFFDPFVVRMLRTISSTTKVPFTLAFGDTSGTNYSSMRSEWQSFRHTVACEQQLLMPLCEAYWRLLVHEAWLDGQLLPDAPWARLDIDPEPWLEAMWSYPVLGNIDPTKETKSDVEAITAGITSPQEVIRQRGHDPEQVLRERREWAEREADLELTPATEPEQPEPTDETGDDAPADRDDLTRRLEQEVDE
ncbi:MAG: phage portal protein [Planctomycetota bacterium]